MNPDDQFGSAVALLDLNRDGFEDLAVGAFEIGKFLEHQFDGCVDIFGEFYLAHIIDSDSL